MPLYRRKKKEVEALPLPLDLFPDRTIPMMLLVDRTTGEQEYIREEQFKKDYERIERSHKRKATPGKRVRSRKVFSPLFPTPLDYTPPDIKVVHGPMHGGYPSSADPIGLVSGSSGENTDGKE